MFCVVTEQDLGRFGRSDVIAGLDLVEIFEYCGPPPNLVVEPAVDRGRRVEARDANGHRFLGRRRDLALHDGRFRAIFYRRGQRRILSRDERGEVKKQEKQYWDSHIERSSGFTISTGRYVI